MQCAPFPNSATSSQPRVGRSRRPGRWSAVVLLGATLALAACGSSARPTILNTEKVEQAIQQSSLAQRKIHADVSCPSGVQQKKGLAFSCAAVVGGGTTRFLVTQVDGSGHVHYRAL
jgi:hypothetical protein